MKYQNHNRGYYFVAGIALQSLILSGVSYASDERAEELLQNARDLYAERMDLSKNEKAIEVLAEAELEAEDSDLKYDILVLTSRALYWKGIHQSTKESKKQVHELGQKKADQAKAVDADYAEAYYFAGINLGRWCEAEGVLASLGRKEELMGYMGTSIAKITRDFQPGETVDGYGPHRVLGRMYFKLPGFAGGSLERSKEHLSLAVSKAKNFALNIVYYAETLHSGSAAEKTQAKHILNELLASDPNTYNTDRTPETLEEFEAGRQLKNQIGA